MIPLPQSLTVNRDEASEKALYERARTWLAANDRQPGVHASDLLMPLKAYWKTLDPQPWSERETGLFLVGKVLHAFILSTSEASQVDIRATDEGSTYSEELGLWYSPDKIGANIPVEFKTSRGMYPAKYVQDMETYLIQLLVYMAARRVVEGCLVVYYISAKDESGKTYPQFRVFRVSISPEELEQVVYHVKKLRGDLVDAITRKDPRNLPLCPAWACHPEQCPWWEKCKPPGRYENFNYLKGKRK